MRLLHHEVILHHLWLGNPKNSCAIVIGVPSIGTLRDLEIVITGVEYILIGFAFLYF